MNAGAVTQQKQRKVYVHLPMTKGGKAQVKLDQRGDVVLSEGDGAFITADAGAELSVESVGTEDAEVVIMDSAP